MFLDNSTVNAPEYYTYPGKLENYKGFKPLLTALLFLVFYGIFLIALFAVALGLVLIGGGNPIEFLSTFRGGYDTLDVYSAPGAIISLGNIAIMLPAIMLALKITKERPFRTLTSSRGGWNKSFFTKALILAFLLNGIPQIVIAAIEGGFSHVSIRYTIFGFIVFLLLVPFQCMAEEYIFRGFIGQTIASWLKNPIPAMIVSTIIFMVMHGYNGIGQIGVFIAGLALFVLIWYTKGLEASCALHIVNNTMAFLLSGIGVAVTSSDSKLSGLITETIIYILFVAAVIFMDKKKKWFSTEDSNNAEAQDEIAQANQ